MKFEYDSELDRKYGCMRSAICSSYRSAKEASDLCDELIRDALSVGFDRIAARVRLVKEKIAAPVSNLNGLEKVLDDFVAMIPEPQQKDMAKSDRWVAKISLNDIQSLVDFAYKQGFHEMGYDPVENIRKILGIQAQEEVDQGIVDAIDCTDNGQNCGTCIWFGAHARGTGCIRNGGKRTASEKCNDWTDK